MTRQRLVIIGAGMAGTRLAEEVMARDADSTWDIALIGREADEPYNRILLSEVLAGSHRAEDLRLLPDDDSDGLRRILGTRVMAIHRSTRTVHLSSGAILPFDRLVLATGSVPILPPLTGLRSASGELQEQCFAFRTLDDCRGIIDASASARRAVVIGGGLLGLEAARGLAGRGIAVEVLHAGQWLMNSQLDSEAGEVLARTLSRLGIQPYLEAVARAIKVDADGRLTGVRLTDGYVLDCDLVVFAAGVRPNTQLARDARLEVDRGVVVDSTLTTTSDPSISAIGDCAQVDGVVHGLVGPAWDHAAVLAERLTDAASSASYAGSRVVTRLKASGIEMAAMGDTSPMPADSEGSLEVVSFSDYARGVYKKVVLRDGRVTGAILLGDVETVGTLTLAMDRGTAVPSNRIPLLFAGGVGAGEAAADAAHAPDEATLCHCNHVTHGAVRCAIDEGADSVAGVARVTRATTGCGTCRHSVESLLAAATTHIRRLA